MRWNLLFPESGSEQDEEEECSEDESGSGSDDIAAILAGGGGKCKKADGDEDEEGSGVSGADALADLLSESGINHSNALSVISWFYFHFLRVIAEF